MLSAATPYIRFGGKTIQDQLFKMSAEETERAMAEHPLGVGAGRDVRCEPWHGAWDYACTFVLRPRIGPERAKVGVRVGHSAILAVSPEYPADARHILQ